MASELAAALAKVQAELRPIERNAEGQAGNRRHMYADLAAVSSVVLPLLGKHGLSFTARPTLGADGRFVLAYSLLHSSGDREDGEYPLQNGTPQQLGSAITYARRYTLCAITGAAPEGEDDDGAAAAQAKPSRSRTRIPGPDHERLRDGTARGRVDGAKRSSGPIPDDENQWQKPPDGGQAAPPRQQGSPAGAIIQHFKRLGIEDREERLVYTGQLAGVDDLQSTTALEAAQSKRVLDMLSRCRDIGQLQNLTSNGDAPGGAS